MAKLFTLLLACLPVLLLAGRLPEQSGLHVTFIADVNNYTAEQSASGVWQLFQQVDDQGWVLGEINQYDCGYDITALTLPAQVDSTQSMKFPLPTQVNMTGIKFKFDEDNDSAQVFLVDGGVGETFASIVIKLPVNDRDVHPFCASVYFRQ